MGLTVLACAMCRDRSLSLMLAVRRNRVMVTVVRRLLTLHQPQWSLSSNSLLSQLGNQEL